MPQRELAVAASCNLLGQMPDQSTAIILKLLAIATSTTCATHPGSRKRTASKRRMTLRAAAALLLPLTLVLAVPAQKSPSGPAPTDQTTGHLETVATFPGPMPEGVTVSHTNRIFVNFARWGDDIPFTVAEIVNGKAVPYPNADINDWPGRTLPNPNAFGLTPEQEAADQTHFVSVQSVVVDPADHLWVLDTGAPLLMNTVPGGPKLVAIDLATNTVVRTILLPPETCGVNCYLNDVRFDLRVGGSGPQNPATMVGSKPAPNPNTPPKDPKFPTAERTPGHADAAASSIHGTAYITDSSSQGPNAIIVVDLASGKSARRLNQHISTVSEPGFLMFAEGQPVYQTLPGHPAEPVNFAADSIAISADGAELFYCPINSTKLYAVSTAALRDSSKSDAQVGSTVRIATGKMPSDGLESDSNNNIYMTDPVTDSIHRFNPHTGLTETLVHDPRLPLARHHEPLGRRLPLRHRQPAAPPAHHAQRPRPPCPPLPTLPPQDRRPTRPPQITRTTRPHCRTRPQTTSSETQSRLDSSAPPKPHAPSIHSAQPAASASPSPSPHSSDATAATPLAPSHRKSRQS